VCLLVNIRKTAILIDVCSTCSGTGKVRKVVNGVAKADDGHRYSSSASEMAGACRGNVQYGNSVVRL
jgi:hypothetical protein